MCDCEMFQYVLCAAQVPAASHSCLPHSISTLRTLLGTRDGVNLRDDVSFIITKKASARAFSWLKVPTTTFTFKTLLTVKTTLR